jgi:hypothetical protein
MPFEVDPPGNSLSYFFDAGIIARGLFALWRATGDAEYREVAVEVARSMQRDFRGERGYFPVLELPGKQPRSGNGRWSREPGCYQLKAAMAWLESGERELVEAYDSMLESFLADHSRFLDNGEDRESTMDRLHAYCYFLEGLLPRASLPDCAEALRNGIGLVRSLLVEIAPRFERSDVCAQLLRIRLYCAALGVVPLDAQAAEDEAARIRAYQYRDRDPRLDGGFCFGRRGSEMTPFANPVSTAFAVQALEMWHHLQAGRPLTEPSALV